ncbi:unnamed protein product, partial [Amoebophrya sp. A120]|eukprot:GSA120T00016378001.1
MQPGHQSKITMAPRPGGGATTFRKHDGAFEQHEDDFMLGKNDGVQHHAFGGHDTTMMTNSSGHGSYMILAAGEERTVDVEQPSSFAFASDTDDLSHDPNPQPLPFPFGEEEDGDGGNGNYHGKKKNQNNKKTDQDARGRATQQLQGGKTASRPNWLLIAAISLGSVVLLAGIAVIAVAVCYGYGVFDQASSQGPPPPGPTFNGGTQGPPLQNHAELQQLNELVQQDPIFAEIQRGEQSRSDKQPILVSSGRSFVDIDAAVAALCDDQRCFDDATGEEVEVEEHPGQARVLHLDGQSNDHLHAEMMNKNTGSSSRTTSFLQQQDKATGRSTSRSSPVVIFQNAENNNHNKRRPLVFPNNPLLAFVRAWNGSGAAGSSVANQHQQGGNAESGKDAFLNATTPPRFFFCRRRNTNISGAGGNQQQTADPSSSQAHEQLCQYPAVGRDGIAYESPEHYVAAGAAALLPGNQHHPGGGMKLFKNLLLKKLMDGWRKLHNLPEVPDVAVLPHPPGSNGGLPPQQPGGGLPPHQVLQGGGGSSQQLPGAAGMPPGGHQGGSGPNQGQQVGGAQSGGQQGGAGNQGGQQGGQSNQGHSNQGQSNQGQSNQGHAGNQDQQGGQSNQGQSNQGQNSQGQGGQNNQQGQDGQSNQGQAGGA